MYTDLGGETTVYSGEIIGIFDIDNTTVSKITRDFLREAERTKQIMTISEELPKSFIIADKNVFVSPLATATLRKRWSLFEKENEIIQNKVF